MKNGLGEFARGRIRFGAAILIFTLSCGVCAGQKKKKKANPDNSTGPMPTLPHSPAEEIDNDIGQMLGAFQVGDIEAMHKYYDDNATFVRGVYEPPLVGWSNYVDEYHRERASFQGMQLIRRNTTINAHGDVAWASYEWEFQSTLLNGKPYMARGQTTLVLTKEGNDWRIVHNHTSLICPVCAAGEAHPPAQAPAEQKP